MNKNKHYKLVLPQDKWSQMQHFLGCLHSIKDFINHEQCVNKKLKIWEFVKEYRKIGSFENMEG